MTELERLTERIRSAMYWGWTEPPEIAGRLIEDGDVIVLPCKVGDKVYQTDGSRIYESTVREIIYDTDGIAFDKTAIGTSVFLTREEAEAALAERR